MVMDELLKIVAEGKAQVASDSRNVKTGDVFVAIKGTQVDGCDFVNNAIEQGAEYVVAGRKIDTQNAKLIIVDNPAKALGVLAQAAKGDPAKKLCNLAVTGTNGKTTIGFLVKSILENAGSKCGLVGTVINDTGAGKTNSAMTTPDAVSIADMQKQMVDAGAKYMVIEASSHALDQDRLTSINFKAAAFTNLTGDHLDYHLTMENYLAAKTKLFSGLSSESTAVLNKQTNEAESIADATKAKVMFYAIDEKTDLYAEIQTFDTRGTKYKLHYNNNSIDIDSPLLGMHNISNHLAAAGLAIGAGFNLKQIKVGLEAAKIVPGRLQRVDLGQNFAVLVDYAHTDDALKNVLQTLKPLCKSKLIVVFGCGGDRDKTKRPRMAKVAEQLGNVIIVTSDNPRTENAAAIIDDIVAGFGNMDNITVEPDREKAISLAIKNANADDIILLAGKGHEDYQIIGKEKKHFSDIEVAEKYIKSKI